MNFEHEWAEMETRVQEGEGLLVRRIYPESAQDIYLGLERVRRTRLLVLEVSTRAVPNGFHPLRAKGIRLYVADTGEGSVSFRLELVLPQFADIFTNLVTDVARRVSEQATHSDAVRVLLQRIHQWKLLLGQERIQILTREQQIGLFGELDFLQRTACSTHGPLTAVGSWHGPSAASKDFDLPGVQVEVKTTSDSRKMEVLISNEQQLSTGSGKPLLLVVYSVAPDSGGMGGTLVEAVAAARELFKADSEAAKLFEQKLATVGYFDVHADNYQTTYMIESQHTYSVTSDFPRLVRDTLPPAIHAVQYALSLNGCSAYELEAHEVNAVLTGNDHLR